MRVYGQSFDYWDTHLTLPLWGKMVDDLMDSPPADDLVRIYLQYKKPALRTKHPIPKLPEYEP